MSDSRLWFLLAVSAIGVALVFWLRPILTPFVVGALLAYIGDPIVDWLESHGISRTGAVLTVFVALFAGALALAVLLVPLLEQQVLSLSRQIPSYLDWVQRHLVPRLALALGINEDVFGVQTVKQVIVEHWTRAGGMAMTLVSDISRSGFAVLGWLANLVLTPVVMFYLLRDWDRLVSAFADLLPRTVAPAASTLARDCDAVLGEFLRGQLLVMSALAVIYVGGLWLTGLELALLVGLAAAAVSFVPYLGVVVGVALALTAGFFQFESATSLVWIGTVFLVGQLIESMVLTPWLVGDRIGLHPVAVIFAVMAGGQLFGFFGVLLALPTAAVIVVLLRHAHERYVDSEIYQP